MDGDLFDLNRFLAAQQGAYDRALEELRTGRKKSHWMWYIFPQYAGLGVSAMSQLYALGSIEEAQAFLCHPVLGPRLKACAEALLAIPDKSALQIMGSPDDLKLRSSATLFAHISPADSVFQQLLNKYFAGQADDKTLSLMQQPLPPRANLPSPERLIAEGGERR